MSEAVRDLTVCNQAGCDAPSAYLFTWPGNDQAGICEAHSVKLRNIAAALGMHLQLIPVINPRPADAR